MQEFLKHKIPQRSGIPGRAGITALSLAVNSSYPHVCGVKGSFDREAEIGIRRVIPILHAP